MASDLSNILKEELGATLEQLLSTSSKVVATKATSGVGFETIQFVKVDTKFDFKTMSSSWSFYIPTQTATKFEYMMLGGMGELKTNIDDEIADAVNEIISNVCGSIATSVNAQGFPDLGGVKFESKGNSIFNGSSLNAISNLYEFVISLDGGEKSVLIAFDSAILPFISSITGVISSVPSSMPQSGDSTQNKPYSQSVPIHGNSGTSNIVSFLGEESIENLKLLFDIKLKLSVRLGTKVMLLKDVLKWDVGEIIELDQMVSEPLDILVNGVKIGVGEAVVVEGKFGLKVRTISNDKLKFNTGS